MQSLIIDLLLIAVGVLGLYFGGKYLVNGSVGLSLHFGLSPMIVGLTVMAFGTSAPELFVSMRSALSGHGELAFGNIVGSNIANVLLILGVPAIIAPIRTDLFDSRKPWFEMMFAVLLFWFLVQFEPFTRWQGAVLLTFFVIILTLQIRRAVVGADDAPVQVDETAKDTPLGKIWMFITIGIILLPLGGELLVRGAVDIARAFGVSEAVIGLTIVAIGTSLPELAASVTAARRGETEMALGNVMGSTLFNILLILGTTAFFSTTWLDPKLVHVDIPFMVACSAGLAIFVFGKLRIGRFAGIVMVSAYLLYLYSLI